MLSKKRSALSSLKIGARSSPLSRAQVAEVLEALWLHHEPIEVDTTWVETTGDLNLEQSLKSLEKTDFFTREIDSGLLNHTFDVAIHSAKDLPDPLPPGLCIAAITQGVDPSDVLVLREADTLASLPSGAAVGTSSQRREHQIHALRPDLVCVDIRGPIGTRLALLDQGKVDAVVMAEAALIRLQLTHRNRLYLEGPTVPYQGQLAIVIRADDHEMLELFSCLDAR